MTPTEARALILDNASLPEVTAKEALRVIESAAWAIGVDARASAPVLASIAAFLARPDSQSSSTHGEALVLLGKAREALGGE